SLLAIPSLIFAKKANKSSSNNKTMALIGKICSLVSICITLIILLIIILFIALFAGAATAA
ncbi:MAG: hypothetical protein ACRCVT_05675, partial [Leadbetterella sp.]